jgi:hypothetical protein
MDNLITISDFYNPYMVYAESGEDTETFLNEIITYYQKAILTSILGEIEYNNFEDDLTGTVPASDQWDWFYTGKEYTYNDVTYKYQGIKDVLVRMIYYYWQKETASNLAESGQLRKNLVNAVQVIPSFKMSRAYNEAIDNIINTREYSPTVYNFLSHQQELNNYFEDWVFTKVEKINMYGI